ncbi:hypothetical protein PNOK_0225700 [Pyrrhoderma noxium]|uniref:Uncharacterized protein n=1 Tax=Pyrrhoderma noxium TaxID=2282107 RepID=A0A286URT3_9AGAM|nr:hypothetical protein PNOK_0225700 [Pyrrhoderma noxium]
MHIAAFVVIFYLGTICLAQDALESISISNTRVSHTISEPSLGPLRTGLSTSPTTTIYGLSSPTFPPTLTTCFLPPTGTVLTKHFFDEGTTSYPAGAECIEVIRVSGSVAEQIPLISVSEDGSTLTYQSAIQSWTPLSASIPSSSASSSNLPTATIIGAVLGSVFGFLIIGATLIWIQRQRRASKPSGTWFNRPGGWVGDEKHAVSIEMTQHASA